MVTKKELDKAWRKHFTTETAASLNRYHRLAHQYHKERGHKKATREYAKALRPRKLKHKTRRRQRRTSPFGFRTPSFRI